MQIEAGKYYRTRDGRKIGPAEECVGAFTFPGEHKYVHETDGTYADSDRGLDIIAEWSDGPVRTETVTKRRIVPGVYGRLRVGEKGEVGDYNKLGAPTEITVEIAIQPWRPGYEPHFYDLNAEELDSLAMVASQLAEALRDQ